MSRVKFGGWGTWIDTGEPYRYWILTEGFTVEGVTYQQGGFLYDSGPVFSIGKRFAVRARPIGSDEWRWVRSSDSLRWMRAWLGFPVPPWPSLPYVLAAVARERDAIARLRVIEQAARAAAPADPRAQLPGWVRPEWCGAIATEDVPGTGICAGDVLSTRRRSGVGNTPVCRPELEALRTHWRLLSGFGQVDTVQSLLQNRRRWGRRRSGPDRTVLWIVRPVQQEGVSSPIRAASDDAALFELLHDVGGRLPQGGQHA